MNPQDTVIATDVIYDISTVKLLCQTASHILKDGGYFVLSHVPRASVDNTPDYSTKEVLENFILKKRQGIHSLQYQRILNWNQKKNVNVMMTALQ